MSNVFSITLRLKTMFFLQYFIWGCWLVTLGSYMINTLHFTGVQVGMAYSAKGLASLVVPGLAGIIADRWIRANRLYGWCHLLGASALYLAAQATDPMMMFWAMLLNAVAYMPSMSLSNSIAYFALERFGLDRVKDFPSARVYGTVGFILAMWTVSFGQIELSNKQLYLASFASLLLALYSLMLPRCSLYREGGRTTLFNALGLGALSLFKTPRMAVFFIFAMLLGAALQVSNTFSNPFLHDFARNPLYQSSLAVTYPSVLLSLSQISEVFFILTIPFFLRRYGIKRVMLISMFAWTLRFLFLAYGDPLGTGFLLLVLSMIIYGCAFDFFNISGAIFVDTEVDSRFRASAQGMFMSMVNGLGAYLGALVSGMVVDMFTTAGVKDWQAIWLTFAGYTLVLGVVFGVAFRYRHSSRQVVSGSSI
ncbi:nucleoside permease [Lonsdalea quercina]|uniref:nucleoside permease n=1 Tax=Lonsdalea quercina TaxID=71657 RepID=UPI003F480B3C